MESASQMPLSVRAAEALRHRFGYQFPALGSIPYRAAFAILPRKIDVELLPGIQATLDMRDGTQRGTYWQGSRFEFPTPQMLREWTNIQNAVFFDIGSNYGWFSLFLASVHPTLTVHAFEPNPQTNTILRDIVARNQVGRIRVWSCGLGDEETSARLHLGTTDSGHSTFAPHPDLLAQTEVEIPIHTFDEWRKQICLELPPHPMWVAKIDVEGFELRVIKGMREALVAKAFRGLAIEFLAPTLAMSGTSEQELLALITSYGYEERPLPYPQSRTANRFFTPSSSDLCVA